MGMGGGEGGGGDGRENYSKNVVLTINSWLLQRDTKIFYPTKSAKSVSMYFQDDISSLVVHKKELKCVAGVSNMEGGLGMSYLAGPEQNEPLRSSFVGSSSDSPSAAPNVM